MCIDVLMCIDVCWCVRQYGNCSVERTNAMRYMPNYFRKAQVVVVGMHG